MASHKEQKGNKCLFAMQTTCYRMKNFSFCGKIMSPKIPTFLETITIRSSSKTRMKVSARQNSCRKKWFPKFRVQKIISTGLKCYQVTVCDGSRRGGITYASCRMNE